jgi:hypothetical protein
MSLMVAQPPTADYVAERGTSGIFNWRKWASGDVEIWGSWTGTLTDYETVSPFYAYQTPIITLPVTLIEFISVQFCGNIGDGFASPVRIEKSLTSVGFVSLSSVSGSQLCVFDFSIQGRWK